MDLGFPLAPRGKFLHELWRKNVTLIVIYYYRLVYLLMVKAKILHTLVEKKAWEIIVNQLASLGKLPTHIKM